MALIGISAPRSSTKSNRSAPTSGSRHAAQNARIWSSSSLIRLGVNARDTSARCIVCTGGSSLMNTPGGMTGSALTTSRMSPLAELSRFGVLQRRLDVGEAAQPPEVEALVVVERRLVPQPPVGRVRVGVDLDVVRVVVEVVRHDSPSECYTTVWTIHLYGTRDQNGLRKAHGLAYSRHRPVLSAVAGEDRFASSPAMREWEGHAPRLHLSVMPPSTRMIAPVVKLDAADAKWTASGATSLASPIRPSGTNDVSRSSGAHPLLESVRNGPGSIALTRTFGAKASASPIVSALRPALAQAYGSWLTLATSEPAVPMDDRPPRRGRPSGHHSHSSARHGCAPCDRPPAGSSSVVVVNCALTHRIGGQWRS